MNNASYHHSAAPMAGLVAVTLLAAPARAQWLADQAAAYDQFGWAVAVGDFDDDGFGDLAVGIPYEDRSGTLNVGAVRLYYGGGAGFGSGGQDYLAPGVDGLPLWLGSQEFGLSLAVGDFDGDGVDDLAIGAPGTNVGPDADAGAVVVVPGGAGLGLLPWDAKVFHQDSSGVKGVAEPNDRFGQTLCAADFDGDGACDLAVGVPWEDIGSTKKLAGAVNVLFGSLGTGLTSWGNQLWYEDLGSLPGVSKSYDFFGSALAAGDFDGDGLPDLAIGIPGKSLVAPGWVVGGAGEVYVLYSSPTSGPTANCQRLVADFYADHPGSGAEAGAALAAGDYDGDGIDDLAVGHPGANTDPQEYHGPFAGAVRVFPGDPDGLTVGTSLWLHQDTPGIGGVAEQNDRFGATLATGVFDFTGLDALVIGAPGEAIGPLIWAGAVHVLYGSAEGPKASGSQIWYQNIGGIEGTSGWLDKFGFALAAGDVTGDGLGDLVIGIPGETVASYPHAGAVGILRGTAENGVVATGDLLIHEFVWSEPPLYW